MRSPLLKVQVEANRVQHPYGKAHLHRLLAVFEPLDESRAATTRVCHISLCEALLLAGSSQSRTYIFHAINDHISAS